MFKTEVSNTIVISSKRILKYKVALYIGIAYFTGNIIQTPAFSKEPSEAQVKALEDENAGLKREIGRLQLQLSNQHRKINPPRRLHLRQTGRRSWQRPVWAETRCPMPMRPMKTVKSW